MATTQATNLSPVLREAAQQLLDGDTADVLLISKMSDGRWRAGHTAIDLPGMLGMLQAYTRLLENELREGFSGAIPR